MRGFFENPKAGGALEDDPLDKRRKLNNALQLGHVVSPKTRKHLIFQGTLCPGCRCESCGTDACGCGPGCPLTPPARLPSELASLSDSLSDSGFNSLLASLSDPGFASEESSEEGDFAEQCRRRVDEEECEEEEGLQNRDAGIVRGIVSDIDGESCSSSDGESCRAHDDDGAPHCVQRRTPSSRICHRPSSSIADGAASSSIVPPPGLVASAVLPKNKAAQPMPKAEQPTRRPPLQPMPKKVALQNKFRNKSNLANKTVCQIVRQVLKHGTAKSKALSSSLPKGPAMKKPTVVTRRHPRPSLQARPSQQASQHQKQHQETALPKTTSGDSIAVKEEDEEGVVTIATEDEDGIAEEGAIAVKEEEGIAPEVGRATPKQQSSLQYGPTRQCAGRCRQRTNNGWACLGECANIALPDHNMCEWHTFTCNHPGRRGVTSQSIDDGNPAGQNGKAPTRCSESAGALEHLVKAQALVIQIQQNPNNYTYLQTSRAYDKVTRWSYWAKGERPPNVDARGARRQRNRDKQPKCAKGIAKVAKGTAPPKGIAKVAKGTAPPKAWQRYCPPRVVPPPPKGAAASNVVPVGLFGPPLPRVVPPPQGIASSNVVPVPPPGRPPWRCIAAKVVPPPPDCPASRSAAGQTVACKSPVEEAAALKKASGEQNFQQSAMEVDQELEAILQKEAALKEAAALKKAAALKGKAAPKEAPGCLALKKAAALKRALKEAAVSKEGTALKCSYCGNANFVERYPSEGILVERTYCSEECRLDGEVMHAQEQQQAQAQAQQAKGQALDEELIGNENLSDCSNGSVKQRTNLAQSA